MTQNNFKKKISSLFNENTKAAVQSGVKGTSVGIQVLSLAAKAGILAAAAPFGAAAVIGGAAVVAGGIVAYDKFKNITQKAAAKAQVKENPAPWFGPKFKPQFTPYAM